MSKIYLIGIVYMIFVACGGSTSTTSPESLLVTRLSSSTYISSSSSEMLSSHLTISPLNGIWMFDSIQGSTHTREGYALEVHYRPDSLYARYETLIDLGYVDTTTGRWWISDSLLYIQEIDPLEVTLDSFNFTVDSLMLITWRQSDSVGTKQIYFSRVVK